MKYKRALIGFLVATFIPSIGICSDEAKLKRTGQYCELVSTMIDQVANGQDKSMRAALTEDLNSFIKYFPECGRDKDVVQNISQLLSDENDGVRFYAAASLGNIGLPAKSAVPALHKALQESNAKLDAFVKEHGPGAVLLPNHYSGQAIRAALQKITGKPVPAYNEVH